MDRPKRRHRRKSIEQIAQQKRDIAAGAAEPDDWRPDPSGRMYEARIRAWSRDCPKCGAPARQSCAGAREGTVRWSFHRERWARNRTTSSAGDAESAE
ncbi:hypothetical protein [Sphingobium lactosutens]|jgi:hypothetical protein|uniref:hypothetical protein n=1 Tax=Sphingobium lactosutens TaxID=522773 RepID=UPI000C4187DB|nr:hypothetical protein [Sphingobium lactosutens]MBS51082.1 hypothetical protein [Sphingobium sp.]MCC4256169.1 hypothetical protein [Sphingobium lactosutens]|tara:strand:- start:4228 stop:4521 length:294 start_codon:yes stop_codon:yes gene_type:complete